MTSRRLEEELRRLEPIAEGLARRYGFPAGDADDVRQVARMGLLEALEAWDGRRPLEPFARAIATRTVIDELRTQTRHRRYGGARDVPLEAPGDHDQLAPIDRLAAPAGVLEQLEERRMMRALAAAARTLTPLERSGIAAVLNGVTYSTGSGAGHSSLDNAAQRARAKLRAAVDASAAA